MSKAKPDFEKLLAELEGIVEKLETGGMALDASLAAYERAMLLSKQLEDMLNEGEKRVMALSGGQEIPMDAEDLQ